MPTTATRRRSAIAAPTVAPVHFRVELADLHAHLLRITLQIAAPASQQQVSLPVWIPGSYLVREFAKHLQGLQATQNGQAVALKQLDKCTWQIACSAQHPLELRYEVYARDSSVRAAWLDAERGFFNGTSLCLRVHGQEELPHALTLLPSKATAAWQVATSLPALNVNRRGFGTYQASSYDELVDCPVTLGRFWIGKFKACGLLHRFVVTGAGPNFDGARLLQDTQRICETQIQFWQGEAPFAEYLFMLHAAHDDYGGLEHRSSTALICKRADLPQLPPDPSTANTPTRQAEGYNTLLGLISHEYFHTWNVKQIRPSGFLHYDYGQENYTDLLWFFEGFTSYYDDLLLRRAGLIDDAAYLKLLGKNINQLQQTPGRWVQTAAQASWDAWVKYYRADENTPNATVSYYGKGALIALCLDLTLRAEGRCTLDDVMRALWQSWNAPPETIGMAKAIDMAKAAGTAKGKYSNKGAKNAPEPHHRSGFTQAGLLAVLQRCSGRSFAAELAQWVHSTDELPLAGLLAQHGIALNLDAAPLAQALGLRLASTAAGSGVHIKTVLRGGPAEAAGLAAGDEWLGVWDANADAKTSLDPPSAGWRLSQLEELPLLTLPGQRVTALISRDKRLLPLAMTMPTASGKGAATACRLTMQDAKALTAWLGNLSKFALRRSA
jgi:predicted metalloprotease with PDZ domain